MLMGMTSDYNGNIWVLRADEMLFYNNKQDKFISVPVKDRNGHKFNLPEKCVMSFDEKNIWWLLTLNGLDCFKIVHICKQ